MEKTMKKWLIMIAALLLVLAGCGKETGETPPDYTIPTLPSFDAEQSPSEKLAASIEALKAADSFQMTFGTEENTYTQSVTRHKGIVQSYLEGETEHWLAEDTLLVLREGAIAEESVDLVFAQAKGLLPNDNFLDDFTHQRLIVSPSNTGSFTFALNGLTGEEFTDITGIATEAASCEVSLRIDPEGYFSRLELVMDDAVVFLQVERVNASFTLTAPDWAQ
jgi:hypothetical protein